MSFRLKPSNWYSMSHDQQQAWEREDRELEDADYDRRQAEQRAEEARAEARRQSKRLQAQMDEQAVSYEQDLDQIRGQRDNLLRACEALLAVVDAQETLVRANRSPGPELGAQLAERDAAAIAMIRKAVAACG